MALKRRNRVEATFAMSSMTDLVFLLLLFFVMASTMSSPNDMPLPNSSSDHTTRPLVAKVGLDSLDTNVVGYSIAIGNNPKENLQDLWALDARLSQIHAQDTTMSVALHAHPGVAFQKVVEVLDIVNEKKMRLVIATKKP